MIARELRRVNPPGGVVLTYKVEDSGAALTRLATRGQIQIRPLRKEDLENAAAVVLTTVEGTKDALLNGFRFEPVG